MSVPDLTSFVERWHRRHLLDLESLSAEEITTLLDVAQVLERRHRGLSSKIVAVVRKNLRQSVFREQHPDPQ